MASEKVDLVVVGSGASGSVYASVLAKTGKRVVVLDNGPDRPLGDLISSDIWGRRLKPAGGPILLGGKNPFAYANQGAYAVGGAALHYFAQFPRYLPTDFKMKSEHNRGHDWPISYEDLAPFYDKVAADIGVCHISYLRLSPDKSADASLLAAIVTYSVPWQHRYFEKQYVLIDPVMANGSKAVLPFDWDELVSDDPVVQAFFMDALSYGVGRNGISIPVRNRRGAYAVVSFTSNHSKPEWQEFKQNNMVKLQLISVLIDSAASVNLKLVTPPVKL